MNSMPIPSEKQEPVSIMLLFSLLAKLTRKGNEDPKKTEKIKAIIRAVEQKSVTSDTFSFQVSRSVYLSDADIDILFGEEEGKISS